MKSISYMMKFHIGRPPSKGWWPTRSAWNIEGYVLRWWDGLRWSLPVNATEKDVDKINSMASKPTGLERREITWARRPSDWPARSKT